jgi:hypothetical protein
MRHEKHLQKTLGVMSGVLPTLPQESESSLLRCAMDCLEGLRILGAPGNFHNSTIIPFAILAGHCVEATMKCHLLQNGWTPKQLRKLQHDLLAAWSECVVCGAPFEGSAPDWLGILNWGHNRPHPFRYLPHQYGVASPTLEHLLKPLEAIHTELRKRCQYPV